MIRLRHELQAGSGHNRALLIGLAVGRTTADTGHQTPGPEIQRFQLYQGQFRYAEEKGWTSSVATFRLDTVTGKTSIYMAHGSNAGTMPGFWKEIE